MKTIFLTCFMAGLALPRFGATPVSPKPEARKAWPAVEVRKAIEKKGSGW